MTTGGASIYVQDVDFTLYHGDVIDVLRELEPQSVNCCVTSPPYWGLRDYGADGQIGLEATPDAYVARMVEVFREVRRVLTDDGTLWLNLGDSYAGGGGFSPGAPSTSDSKSGKYGVLGSLREGGIKPQGIIKAKDLVGIPWRVAFALQADGWWLRSDIIWAKPNPMPESVTDRPTKSHEYVFLLSKSSSYFFDADAVREPFAPASEDRYRYAFGGAKNQALADANKVGVGVGTRPIGMRTFPGQQPEAERGPDGRRKTSVQAGDGSIEHRDGERWPNGGRNIRSVWEIATQPYAEAHFATFPLELPRRCIAAGCPADGVVLDPFMGSGTTALVARNLGRHSVGIELNADYCALAAKRLSQQSLLGNL